MEFSFGIITPSYAPDFERCRLLSQSIDRCALTPINHYIVVDRRDLKLFQQLQGSKRQIITVESVLPWWINKIPVLKNGWLSFKTLPIRNWLIQQIVKLAIANYVSDEVLIFVDSDVTFIRQFDISNFVRDGKVRLFREPEVIKPNTEPMAKWSEVSNHLLGLPPVQYPTANYVGNVITWKRENVFQLHQQLEKVSGKDWIETIANSWHLSEYMLYGAFIDLVLKERGQHYFEPQKLCHEYWKDTPMSDAELEQFLATTPPDSISLMISAKAKMPVERYVKLVKANFSNV